MGMTTFAPAPVIGIGDRHRVLAPQHAKTQRSAGCGADLRIDGWLVQPSLNLITRDAARVRLRAQLMDLLICLASRPGKVLLKDEIVTEVWEGRWVAESAISRCIAELRAALDDDAHRPRVIETITKRGYRLIAPVEVVSAPPPPLSPWAVVARPDAAHTAAPPSVDARPRLLWRRLKQWALRSA